MIGFLSKGIKSMKCLLETCGKIDCLIAYILFCVMLEIFHPHGDVTIASEGLQKLGLCSAHMQPLCRECPRSLSCHICCEMASVFAVSSEGSPQVSCLYDKQGHFY